MPAEHPMSVTAKPKLADFTMPYALELVEEEPHALQECVVERSSRPPTPPTRGDADDHREPYDDREHDGAGEHARHHEYSYGS